MEPPLFPTADPQIVRAAPGSVASLLLPLPFGSPPFHYKWSRAGASLDERFIVSDDAGGVRLTVSAARTGDSGVYTLQASNAAGKDTTRVRLEVSPPDEAPVGEDPPNFLRRLQDLTVKVGTRTRFLVEIVSSTECKVTWYRNERRLLETERVALVRDGNFWCADVATVSVDDAGRWTCTAENVGGRASCSAHLNVLVPRAYKRPEFVEELRALLTEQGTVSLECKVVGVPTPVLRWFKDSREIKAGDVFALTANAEDPTSLGTYTCEAVNCMGRAYSSSKVHVVGRASREGSIRPSSGGLTPDPPPIFTKELEDQFVRICEPLTLSCHIVVPPWPRSVAWYNKEGKIEPSERYHVLEDGVGGYLVEVTSAEWADEGEWKCAATTPGGRVGMSACYVSMDVPKNYRKPRFMENLQAVLTEEGLVSFECKVVGFPTPVLSWFKDGQELKPGDVYQLTGTNSLGSYCCIARNCMGQASSSAELTVEDIQNQLNEEEKHQLFSKNQAPKFLQGLKSVEAKIDEPFRFTIKVAIPPEPSLLWYRDDQPVDESTRCHHGKEERGAFYLDIQNLEFLDQAEWKCVAINDFGQSVTSCFLKLIIPRHYKKPRFLENLQAILSDEGAVNLECKVIGVPQPVLKWYKDGEELKPGDIHRIISGQDGTCCLGTYTCEAQNCMGIAASSASLLGFDDSMKVKSKKKSEEQTLQRNLSLSTIHEERTSQMYDTPLGDRTLDDKGEISFSFDGKEVSVSLYETPDLTEEEALQIVEMYADQLSENVTEHNVVELPPLRFVKETSTSGNLLMEAIIIDVSPEYFTSPEEDLRTEADIEDISIADENGPPQLSLDQDQDIIGEDYLEKTMALLSDEKADLPKKPRRRKSDSQKSGDDYFSLSREQSLSEEKKDDDTQMPSESDLQSFASARSSGKPKSKSSKPSLEEPVFQSQESSELTKTMLFKEDIQSIATKPDVSTPKTKRERRSSRSSRRSSSGSEKSVGKLKEEVSQFKVEQPPKKLIADEEYKTKVKNIANSLSKIINDIQIIERDIILQSELMSSAATASKSLEIIGSLISPISEIHSIAEAAKEDALVSPQINSALFHNLPHSFKVLYQSLTIIEKCIDVESDSKTLVKKTCISIIEKCGNDIQSVVNEISSLLTKKNLDVEAKIVSEIELLSAEMINLIRFSADTIKARSLLHEASEFKSEEPSSELQHSKDTQKAIFELKSPLQSLLRIVESTEKENLAEASKIKNSEIILDDMSASIQDLQEALEQIESLSVKESTSTLMKYNTEIIETVMDSVLKLRSSIEQLSNESEKAENEDILKEVLSTVKLNLNEISSHIDIFENNVGKFDILQSENKLEVLQKMAQTLISFENSLPTLDVVPGVKEHMVVFHKNLTKVLENVIESNEATKYFAFMEICDSINRVNSLVKNIESQDLFSLTSLSNTVRIIQDQLIQNVFDPELNCSVLTNIEDILVNLLKNINLAEEVSLKTDSDRIYELDVTKQEESKPNVVIESIEKSIAAINSIVTEERAKDFKSTLIPILENIRPNLEELKQNIASMTAVNSEQEEHASEISEISISQFLANPLCKLYENIVVLNQTIMENVESFKENSEVVATYAQPLHELHTTLEVLQQDVLSQHGEDVLSYENAENIANVVQNLQSCIVLIQEQSGVETADEMSTLEDVSGIKTTAEIMPSDHLVLPTTEEVVTEQVTGILQQIPTDSMTAQTLQTLNEHLAVLHNPDIIEFLETLSEMSDYTSLKSVDFSLGELNEGIQEILHPILIENTNELFDTLDMSKFVEIAEPMQELHQSLSVIDANNIPIYENILKMPSEKIHSAVEKLSEFKNQLDQCLNVIIPAIDTADKTLEISSNINLLKKSCVGLKNTILDSEEYTVSMKPEVCAFSQTLNSFLEATNLQEGIDVTVVKSLTEDLYEKLLMVQDELIQYAPQPNNKMAQEVKLIETVHELENKIAVLEQYHFVELSRTSDIDTQIPTQKAIELETDSLVQISDLVNQAVNVVQDVSHETYTADFMILEDFFKTCKHEFSILRCLITKRPSHKKIIRLIQEFSVLKIIVNDFKLKRSELSLTEDMNVLLNNFILNLDASMKEIEESLIKVVDSQSILLFETPVKVLDCNTNLIMQVVQNNKSTYIEDLVNKFGEVVESIRPCVLNIKSDIIEELQSPSTSYQLSTEKCIVNESMDSFHNYLEEQMSNIVNDEHRQVVESILHCLQKYQDYKDVVGESKILMLLKCLSECSTTLKVMLTEEEDQNKKLLIESEDIALKSILNAMVEPLQNLRSQLLCVQEQITSGADEDSISIDLTSTESYVRALAEINADVLKVLQSEKTIVDETDLSLIENLDKEISTLQENIQTVENTGVANVAKQIALPLEDLEKSLHLAKEKGTTESKTKISKDINSNVSSLEHCLNRFIQLETDLLDVSELFIGIDLNKCLSLAFEIAAFMTPMENIEFVQKINKDKITELKTMLMKYDWLNTDYLIETRDEVVLEKLKRVYLASYQLLAELKSVDNNLNERDENIPEDKAESLLQHIEQYIEFVEIVEEVSAIIKVDDLLETANLARELCESIDDKQQKDVHIQIGTDQELLMQKLQKALSALQVQALDSVLEMAPAFDDAKRQHVLEVVALLEADIRAIIGIQTAVVAPSESAHKSDQPTEDQTSTAQIIESDTNAEIMDAKKETQPDTEISSGVSKIELIESRSLLEESQMIISDDVSEIPHIIDKEELLSTSQTVKYEFASEEEVIPVTAIAETSTASPIEVRDVTMVDQDAVPKTSTIGTFVQHIDEYIREDVIETINKLAEIVGNKDLEASVIVAKELRESIVALDVSPLETVALLQNDEHREQKENIIKLQEALDILNVLTVHNVEELESSVDEKSLKCLIEVVNNLHTDVVTITPPPILESKYLDEDIKDVLQEQDAFESKEQKKVIEDFKAEDFTLTTETQEGSTQDLDISSKQEEEVVTSISGDQIKELLEPTIQVLAEEKESLFVDTSVPSDIIAHIEEITDETLVEDVDSMKKLQTLLSEVINQVDLSSSNETVDDTELLRNILDEVQTVIIKLKRDFNGSANDTLNETLEDLECSVRSVQLQIDENSAPDLLKDACATLQLLVTNMSDIKDHAAHPVIENTESLMQKCSENTELTIQLLDDASKVDVDGQLRGIISKLNIVKDTLKTLWSTFRGDAHTLINNGIDVIQSLDQMEEQIFTLEKDIESSACKADIKDSIVLAVHTVYENISNMRSTITSIQKDYMYENYGKPSEQLLRSLKNITIISECDNKSNWKHLGKCIRQVLNHFEDIKFYVNFDKTARIPSDAAFTKIVIYELTKELNEVVLPNILELYPEISNDVCEILKKVEENHSILESRTTLEVKEKIPIFKNISKQILALTDIIRKSAKELGKKSIKFEGKEVSAVDALMEQKEPLPEVAEVDFQEIATTVIEESKLLPATDAALTLEDVQVFTKTDDITRQEKEDIQYIEAKDEGSSERISSIIETPSQDSADSQKDENLLQKETLHLEMAKEADKKSEAESSEDTKGQFQQELPSCSFTQDETSLQEDKAQHEVIQIKEGENIEEIEKIKESDTQIEDEEPYYKENVTKASVALEQEENKEIVDTIRSESEIESLPIEEVKESGIEEKELDASLQDQKEEAIKHKEVETTVTKVEEKTNDKEKALQPETDDKEKQHAELEDKLQSEDENLEKLEKLEVIKVKDDEKLLLEEVTQESEKLYEKDVDKHAKEEDVAESLQNQEKEAQVKEKIADEKLHRDKELQEIRTKCQDDEATLHMQKEEGEIKSKEKEEKLHMEKEQQEIEKKRQDEKSALHEVALQKQEKEAELRSKEEEETLRTKKEIQEIEEERRDDESASRKQEDAELRRKEEELKTSTEKEIQDKRQVHEDSLQTQKEEAAIKREKEEEKLHVKKEQPEFEKNQQDDENALQKPEEEAEVKRQEEEKLRIEKEQSEVEKKRQDDKDASQKQIEQIKTKRKDDEERLNTEKEQLEIEKKQQDDEELLQKQKVGVKCEKEEEKLDLEKEQQEIGKKRKDDEAVIQKQEEEAEIKRKLEEEKLRIENEQQEILKTHQVEKEMLQKQKQEAELKQLNEEDKSLTEKDQQEVEKMEKDQQLELRKQKAEPEPELKKEESKPQIDKEQQEVVKIQKDEVALQKQKEETEIKSKVEEQMLHLGEEMSESKERRQDEAKTLQKPDKEEEISDEIQEEEKKQLDAETQKQKEEPELKCKEDQEKLHVEKEQQELDKKRQDEDFALQSSEEKAELKRNEEEEKLCIEKEPQEIQKTRQDEEETALKKQKGETQLKQKQEEEKHHMENEKQELEKRRQDEEDELQKHQKEAEAKRKEQEEKIRIDKEQQEVETKRHEEEAALQKQNEEADVKRKEEEEKEKLSVQKDQQEAEKKRQDEEAALQKQEKEAEMKRKEEEEELRVVEEKQQEEKKRQDEEATLQKHKEEAEMKRKEEEEKLRVEKEHQEAEIKREDEESALQKQKEESDIKRKEEEQEVFLEKEKQEVEKRRRDEEAELQKQKEEAEIKHKEEEEKLRVEKELQEAEKKRQDEEAALQKQKEEVETKLKEEEEKLCVEKEQQEAEKKRQDEDAALQKQNEEAGIKRKEEEEKLRVEKEQQEAEKKRQDEEAALQKQKEEAEIKRKEEEEKLRVEKEQQEAEKIRQEEAALQKQKEEAEIKRKEEEEKLRVEKEQQEAEKKRQDEEAALQKQKDEAEMKRKEEEKLRVEKEQQEAEKKCQEEAALQKQKEEAEIKRKEEEEKLRVEKEQQEAEKKRQDEEAALQKQKEEAEIKRKEEEEKLRVEKEQQEAEKIRQEEAALQKQKNEAEVKRKEEEEKLRIEKEKQEEEKRRQDEESAIQKHKEEAEVKRKEEEEKLRVEKEQQEAEKKRQDEESAIQKQKDEADIKRKEEEQKLLVEKEKQKEEKRRQDEESAIQKQKDEADIKCKEEEQKLLVEKEKQKEEKRRQDEEAVLQKQKEEATIKRKEEEEKLRVEKEQQEAEKKREDEEAALQKLKEEAEVKRKEEEEKLRVDKERHEAEEKRQDEEAALQKQKEEAEVKRKEEEEKLRVEKERQEAEKKRQDEEAALQKQKEEVKRKEEEEKLRVEKEQQEAEKKRQDEEAALQKQEEKAEVKRKKEEEKLRVKKEQQEAEKKRQDEEDVLQKQKEEAEIKRKEEEEKLRVEKEQQEAEKKRQDEEAALQKQKDEAEMKRKEEEKLRVEKEQQEAEKKRQEEAALQKQKEEAEIKRKEEEEKLRVEKEQQEAEKKRQDEEAALQKQKEEAEIKRKEEEEKLRVEKEQQEAEKIRQEEAALQKQKDEAEIKRKEEEEKLRLVKEQQEAEKKRQNEEATLQKQKEEAEVKSKEEQLRAEKEQQNIEKKRVEEEAALKKQNEEAEIKRKDEEQKLLSEKEKQESEKKRRDEAKDLQKKEHEVETKQKKEKKKPRVGREKQDKEETRQPLVEEKKLKKEIEENLEQSKLEIKKEHKQEEEILPEESAIVSKKIGDRKQDTEKKKPKMKKDIEDDEQLQFSKSSIDGKLDKSEITGTVMEPYEKSSKLNGSIDKYKVGEIDVSSLGETKYERKEKPVFINYNNKDVGLEMYRPPGYIEKRNEQIIHITAVDLDTSIKSPTTYRAQSLLNQAQLRSSTPQYYDTSRSSESIEKRDARYTPKALSETRSTILEKRSGASRDHKRKPVFSTYLTDRTAVEGSRVKLTCSVLSSTDPTITWFKNGVLLDNKLKYRTKFVDGLITLEVLNAVPSDSAEYTCTVKNEGGSVNSSANLKVYPSFEASPIPPTFTRSIRDTYHLAENELVLECRIRGQPLPTITWLKDERPISSDERYQAYYLADGVCRLAISAPTTADSGKYTCKAENSMWSDQITHVVNFTGKESRLGPNLATIERSRFNRQVLESRRPHFTNVLTDYKVTRGGTIGLQVEIKGSPTRVEWLREGHAVTDIYRNAHTFVEHGLYTLALTDVTETESGLYTCRAWGAHGNVDMNAAITVVQPNELEGKPAMIVSRPEKDVLISVGEDLNISFRVQGEPKPKVIFMKGIRDITNSQRVCKMTSDDYVKFTLKRSVVSDAGTYCILARNAYGCDRAFVTVVVRQRASSENLISDWTYPLDDITVSIAERKYKSVPDRIPGEPSVVDGGNNWVSLAWSKPDHQESAPVLAYKVESWLVGKEGGARWVELGITPLNSFDAFNLKQGEEYHFRVTPRNRYGWGEPVQTSTAIGIGLAGDRPEFTEILPGQLKVLLGQTASLSCSFKGKPIPEIVWMKNGHEIEENEDRIETLLSGFDCCLTIRNVQIEDEARYSCEASNVHGRASTYARMAVITDQLVWEADAKLKRERSAGVEGEFPPQFTMRLRDRRVQATYPVRLTCQVIGSPPPILTWFKDGMEVCYDNRRSQSQDEHFHTLEIAPTSLEDGGVYEAMARNSSGAVSCRCSLVVDKGIRAYIAPEFCCGLEPLYRLFEGEELRISAMVEAYPSVGVTWYRDGVRLRPSRRAIMTLDHDGQIELALASVTSRDAGVYTCTASNEVGRASTSGKVEVVGGDQVEETGIPPVVISPDVPYSKEPMFIRKPRSSEAREGDTVIIECEVIGDPKPDVYWLRDFLKPDYYRDANHFKRVGAGPEYRFEIPHAKLDFTGTYSVVARNAHGEAKAIISLQILAKDITATDDAHNVRYGRVDVIPRFDKELTDLLCYDGDAVEFECRVSGNPEPYIKWLHYKEVIHDCPDFETSFEGGTARLKIKQVTAEDEGTFTCEASNSLGKAKSSACLVVYPPGEPNTLSQRLRRPALLSAASTPRSTPRATPARSMSRTPGPDARRLCSPSREIAPKFYTYPFNKVVEEGERVIFKCAVKGLPNPWATWDKDGIVITPTSRITIREKDEILRILEIEEVTIEDVGMYRITLENDYGRAEASARLEVITRKGKFYGGIRSASASPRRTLYRRRTPSTSRQD